ncbi:MAG TPA: MFS transporter [Anaerolinea sp.]|nr:MFS transporter [Anaerolinea sp.]
MNAAIRRLVGYTQPFPAEHRSNFTHLFWDIAWWGLLNGSTIVFLAVYASRLGASTLQVGLLTASPALINLLFTFPVSSYARGKPTHQVLRWAALITRMFYVLLIPLPILFAPQIQIWTIIAITLTMNITGTLAAVMGNAFLAENVPVEWRGQVVGTRNALLAASSMITSLVVGQILAHLPFQTGYQIVFAIGWFGAMMSALHLFLIKPQNIVPAQTQTSRSASPWRPNIRLEILRGPFGRVLIVMFLFHVAVFFPNPIFPLYQVNVLKMSDEVISLGSSFFWIVYFFSSTQIGPVARRLGFKNMTAVGTLFTSLASLIFTFSYHPLIYLACQFFSGLGWAMIGVSLVNYLLERVPPDDRPAHLAWFNIAVNLAVLIIGLIASPVAAFITLFGGMLLAVAIRFLAGLAIFRWG